MGKSSPIGLFDSGVGGLTVAHALHTILPSEDLVYFGDTAHLPYGDKSKETILHYSLGIADFLLEQKCKVILIACNTASANAFEEVKAHVGDRAVLKVSDMLRDTFRRSDIIARMGGDEFAVLALEATEDNEVQLVARFRAKVQQFNERGKEPYQLSISLGTARFDGQGRTRLDELLAKADATMYEEKRGKRRDFGP